MRQFGQPAVHTSLTIHHNNYVHLHKEYYRESIMVWDVVAALLSGAFLLIILVPQQHSVVTVSSVFSCWSRSFLLISIEKSRALFQIFRQQRIPIRYLQKKKKNIFSTFINYFLFNQKKKKVAEETSHLAPHGVPSNPIPRALSSNRLNDLNNQNAENSYGTYQTTGGNLDIPGGAGGGGVRNPFVQ